VTTVHMINSVDEHVAGVAIELPDELADRFILLGYASGELSREYSDNEKAAIQDTHQVVSLG
jgi:hypothetical protein